MASIVKRTSRGRTVYQAKIRLTTGSTSATFDKLTDAKRWAAETESAIRRGAYFDDHRKHTLSEAIEAYLQSPRFLRLAERETRAAHLRWWAEQYGALPLARLTADKLAQGRDKLKAKGLTGATCNRRLAALSACLTHTGRELGWLEVNPASRVDRFAEDGARDRVLSDFELKKLLDACTTQDMRDLIVLARYTAARRGELTGLHRKDVDLERRMVTFRDTKNGTDRSVALVGPALDVMRRRLKVPRLDTPLLFPSPVLPGKPADMRAAFEGAVRRAGLDGVVFHMLRHTALTRLAEAGATLSELQQIAGHRSLSMVARYRHLTEDSTRGALERMALRTEGVAS
jgi:integrase